VRIRGRSAWTAVSRTAAGIALAAMVAGCSDGVANSTTQTARLLPGGTVTFALQPGSAPNYIFPLVSSAYFTSINEDQFEYLQYRPLFWDGINGTTAFNPSQSLASYPKFTVDAQGDTVATVTLKHWLWSNGQPVTTRDVEFWMNLLEANKADWGVYSAGAWPDNIKSISYSSLTDFTITFNAKYNVNWLFYDEMAQLFPLPQQVMDKTSASSPVGNYDTTPAGAVAVYTYLNQEARDLSTYGTNPLWKVVSGPWILDSYQPTTGYSAFVRNPRYSGPKKSQVTHLIEVPYTSTASEFNSLRAGTLDVGYVPPSDVSEIPYLKSHGYTISAWYQFGVNFMNLDYSNPQVGPILKQLYFRQALQELVDQPADISAIYEGYAKPTYGPVPSATTNQYISPQERTNPYPYSLSAASKLLRDHGWAVRPKGLSTCIKPGSGAGECGLGIVAGSPLKFQLGYTSGSVATTSTMQVLASAASRVGIELTLDQQPYNTLTTTIYSCVQATQSGCGWQLGADLGWEYYAYPSGEQLFKGGASGNAGWYNDSTANRLIKNTLTQSGLQPMFTYENYLAKQIPELWLPMAPYQITAYKTILHGVTPQGLNLQFYPEMFTVSS
jgi:peptide/nickel transport system substrate-binding protein